MVYNKHILIYTYILTNIRKKLLMSLASCIDGEEYPEGVIGWLLFYDKINASVQNLDLMNF